MMPKPKKITRAFVALLIMIGVSLAACAPETTPTQQVVPPTQAPTQAPTDAPTAITDGIERISLPQGWGAKKGWWQVYFTIPTEERNRALWTGGIDSVIAEFISTAQTTLDIAAFELNNETITEAIIEAHERGVTVRIVTDNDHGIGSDDSSFAELEAYGIPVVDDARSGLMHNKFIVVDGLHVLMGSTNFTDNGIYRNDNNFLILRSRQAAESYTEEFVEMFVRREFGITSSTGNERTFNQEGTPITILYGAENDVIGEIIRRVQGAQERIRFMAFAFTLDDIGDAMLERARAGVSVEGVYETVGSGTRFSTFTPLYCAGLDVRRDGNPSMMHHKVIIIDDTVITGSFNFSQNASRSNDENIIFITDADLAELYMEEFERVQEIGNYLTDWNCP